MNSTAVYQPIVTIDPDGGIECDWFQSYVGNVDENGNDVDGDPRDSLLDARLDAIRFALSRIDGDDPAYALAELVRPFFNS